MSFSDRRSSFSSVVSLGRLHWCRRLGFCASVRVSPLTVSAPVLQPRRGGVWLNDIVVGRVDGVPDMPTRPLTKHLQPEVGVHQDRDASDSSHGGYLKAPPHTLGSKGFPLESRRAPSHRPRDRCLSTQPALMAAMVRLTSPCGLPSHHPSAWYRQCPSPGMVRTGPGWEASPIRRYSSGRYSLWAEWGPPDTPLMCVCQYPATDDS